jgi:hypothetical protein
MTATVVAASLFQHLDQPGTTPGRYGEKNGSCAGTSTEGTS